MRKVIFSLSALALLNACTSGEKPAAHLKDTSQVRRKLVDPSNDTPCKPGQTLVYEEPGVISTFTEDKMRGTGVVSFQLDVNDRLDIYYPDQSTFGFLVHNEDGSYYTLNMPSKLLARQFVPTEDFAQFDFDAEAVDTDQDYLIIYANKEKLKVKKAGNKYTFNKWGDYVRSQTVKLKKCNLLPGAGRYPEMLFEVTEVAGDRIKIKSAKDCSAADSEFKAMEGWINWRKNGNLLVDFSTCD